MTQSSIRALRRSDLVRVASLVDANAMFPSDMLEEMVAPHLTSADPTQRWVVIESAGAVQGAAFYAAEQMAERVWNVLMICVAPENHGEGLGVSLMRHIEAELAGEGARLLLVETSGLPSFERTRGFYDMLGYDREARIREYYDVGDDKIVFRKLLA